MSSAEVFLRRLRGLDAAAKAALRASAARPSAPDVAAHDAFTAAWWPIRNAQLPRDACRIVAALYFWHPKEGGSRPHAREGEPGNLIDSLRLAVSLPHARGGGLEPTERLVEQLLAAPFAGLPELLLTAVQRLAKANVPIDWPQLIRDLAAWERPGGEGTVQDEWANSWLQTGGKYAH